MIIYHRYNISRGWLLRQQNMYNSNFYDIDWCLCLNAIQRNALVEQQ